ncbi:hypothetical protein HYG93_17600 [Acinetobacter sp. SwsAc6]|uniref:Uncharacterized protein n=1 Tax=Acinetobacter cumulans TaxID=2136182 RepID=A0A498D8A8_9GAMM|nr:hypothetical protein [Acinetobacter sp. SwsAc6]QCO22815.1 hypothetical protein C9E88_005810 [Acinetobacter cumulans]RFS33983.1 hypothetical protein DYI81_04790 [Acinetobacter sp. SWAC5]RKG45713.1 hypothetical protein D7V68_15405 [Acinetobacter cumulans]RLL38896.1 hypothetical protein D9K80_01770 [Acinetobacter cumulans]
MEPNKLPELKYGENYDNSIEIEKLKIIGDLVIKTDLPENSGISIQKNGKDDFFFQNTIKVYGTPRVKGNYYILLDGNFVGGTFGGMTNFKKKYDITIK